MPDIGEAYLGDGVYATAERGMIKLTTHRETGEHVIFLEFDVLTALVVFARNLGWDCPSYMDK